MSKENLDTLMEELLAIPKEKVKPPSIAVAVYTQEAEDQYAWAAPDVDQLVGHGLDRAFYDSLPERAGALRYAQSLWAKENKSREEAEAKWMEKAPGAFKTRDDLLEAFRYAFRKNEELRAKVAIIAEGASREDMIQDLSDLAVLGNANIPLLEKIHFDTGRLGLAASTSDSMAELLAGTKGDRLQGNKTLDLRNRAYTCLKEAVDEVRDCGKYAFSGNAERLKGYRSEFLRKYRGKNNGPNVDEVGE